MKGKDFTQKQAQAAMQQMLQNYTTNQNRSPYFVGQISQDQKTITDPLGNVYNLIYTGSITEYEIGQKIDPYTAIVVTNDLPQITSGGSSKGYVAESGMFTPQVNDTGGGTQINGIYVRQIGDLQGYGILSILPDFIPISQQGVAFSPDGSHLVHFGLYADAASDMTITASATGYTFSGPFFVPGAGFTANSASGDMVLYYTVYQDFSLESINDAGTQLTTYYVFGGNTEYSSINLSDQIRQVITPPTPGSTFAGALYEYYWQSNTTNRINPVMVEAIDYNGSGSGAQSVYPFAFITETIESNNNLDNFDWAFDPHSQVSFQSLNVMLDNNCNVNCFFGGPNSAMMRLNSENWQTFVNEDCDFTSSEDPSGFAGTTYLTDNNASGNYNYTYSYPYAWTVAQPFFGSTVFWPYSASAGGGGYSVITDGNVEERVYSSTTACDFPTPGGLKYTYNTTGNVIFNATSEEFTSSPNEGECDGTGFNFYEAVIGSGFWDAEVIEEFNVPTQYDQGYDGVIYDGVSYFNPAPDAGVPFTDVYWPCAPGVQIGNCNCGNWAYANSSLFSSSNNTFTQNGAFAIVLNFEVGAYALTTFSATGGLSVDTIEFKMQSAMDTAKTQGIFSNAASSTFGAVYLVTNASSANPNVSESTYYYSNLTSIGETIDGIPDTFSDQLYFPPTTFPYSWSYVKATDSFAFQAYTTQQVTSSSGVTTMETITKYNVNNELGPAFSGNNENVVPGGSIGGTADTSILLDYIMV